MDVSEGDKEKIRQKIERLKQSKFKQQTLPAWRPVPTAMSTMFTFSIFSIVFLSIGMVLYVMSDQIIEMEQRYDEFCESKLRSGECTMDFHTVNQPIQNPIYIYYQLDNFYQNHRRYVKSRDNAQLAGTWKDQKDLTDCDPIILVDDLWAYQ